MASTIRQQKFSRLILKELSDIIQRGQISVLENEFITVMDVTVSPDFSLAKIYLSLSLVKDKNGLIQKLNIHKKEIRKELGSRIRNQARIVPEIAFFIDEVEENAQRIEEIINNLNIPPEEG